MPQPFFALRALAFALALSASFATLLLATAATAAADTAVRSYAIVVGSNPGGPGQSPLRYAEADARAVADALRDVGGVPESRLVRLTSPSVSSVLESLDALEASLAEDQRQGRPTRLFFYYSGHARSRALNLGPHELALDVLRARIESLPATLKLVVLDACQSGAFSRTKGISKAADFSVNSVDQLRASGIAIMASSTATELSQESERLRGSYFTHHLVAALRGAGDKNGDGRVSIDEAYRYAYGRTLVATARTSVGRQHVTLETELRGHGDVALTFPGQAEATLTLPADLTGDLVLRRGKTVTAEVHKAPGAVTLGLPAGRYDILITAPGAQPRDCVAVLAPGQATDFAGTTCRFADVDDGATKGRRHWAASRLSFEFALGVGWSMNDGYLDTLETFGYDPVEGASARARFAVGYRLSEVFSVVGAYTTLDRVDVARRGDTVTTRFDWSTSGLAIALRAQAPVFGSPSFSAFAEAGGGLARASSNLADEGMVGDLETYYGPLIGGAVGLQYEWAVSRMHDFDIGFTSRLGLWSARTLENRLGDVRDSGGLQTFFGLYFSL